VRRNMHSMAILAAIAGLAASSEFGGGMPAVRDKPIQSQTRRAEKLAAAQAKRERKAARRAARNKP
jgi:hypothetical protein